MQVIFLSCRYVVGKDTHHNVVFVSRKYFSLDKRRRMFRVGSLMWFNGFCPVESEQIHCKVSCLEPFLYYLGNKLYNLF
jgi:hypothetical protein